MIYHQVYDLFHRDKTKSIAKLMAQNDSEGFFKVDKRTGGR